jgi:hypothetical protein
MIGNELNVSAAAEMYVAEKGFEHSGGIIEQAFEAGARWAMSYNFLIRNLRKQQEKDALIRELVAALRVSLTPTPSETRAIDAAIAKAKAAGYEP